MESLARSLTQPYIKLEGHWGKTIYIYLWEARDSGPPEKDFIWGRLDMATNTHVIIDGKRIPYYADTSAIEEIYDDERIIYWNPAFREFLERHSMI